MVQIVHRDGDIKKRRAPGSGRGPPLLFGSTALVNRMLSCCACGHFPPKLSNSPFRTPPRNACHSSGVNRRTGPSESLLLRTPISPSARLATSTQLPLEKLSELLTQCEPEPGLSAGFPCIGLPTVDTSLIVGDHPECDATECRQIPTYRSHYAISLTASLTPGVRLPLRRGGARGTRRRDRPIRAGRRQGSQPPKLPDDGSASGRYRNDEEPTGCVTH